MKYKGLKTVGEVIEETTAGKICVGCIPDIEDILN